MNGVRHEFRVADVFPRVGHHQVQLGRHVFQIVHDERRQAIERLELPGLGKRLAGYHESEIACRLPAEGLEQIVVFPIQLHVYPRLAQNDECLQLVVVQQRQDQPRLR